MYSFTELGLWNECKVCIGGIVGLVTINTWNGGVMIIMFGKACIQVSVAESSGSWKEGDNS